MKSHKVTASHASRLRKTPRGTARRLRRAIREIRITKGATRYAGEFVAPTAAFPESQAA